MERTERDIISAFNRLLSGTGIERITTQMIANEAKVSRATFYRYFRDKYDVLNRNYKDLLECGSLAAAREKGLVRMEGKEYVVQDGDVILFRFNV